MTIVVMVLHVVSVFKSCKQVLFWIVYNNYSMKALLNFIRVVFINHQGIKKNNPQELLSFHTVLGYHILLQRVSCHSNGIITCLVDASLF